jgi:hypothetical protein
MPSSIDPSAQVHMCHAIGFNCFALSMIRGIDGVQVSGGVAVVVVATKSDSLWRVIDFLSLADSPNMASARFQIIDGFLPFFEG